jgi:hypothetical protein
MASAHTWADITSPLSGAVPKFNDLLSSDGQYKAFTTTDAITKSTTFGIKSSGSDNAILVEVSNGKGVASTGSYKKALFTLSALPQQWEEFFKPNPVAPYQSYWGMFGMNIKQEGIEVKGDEDAYVNYTHIWRRALELLHDAQCGPMKMDEQPDATEDHLVGRYVFIEAPIWGRCKVCQHSRGNAFHD